MLKIIIFVLFLLFSNGNFSSYDLNNHLGTKTPYRVSENNDTRQITYKGCSPVKIWMIIRHGTRLPSKSLITEMHDRLPQIRDNVLKNNRSASLHLSQIQLDSLRNWKASIHEDDEKILAHEGEDEMINLAERMQLRLPAILPDVYSNTSYKLKYTATQRAEKSAQYFATGLFGKLTAKYVWYPEALHQDPVLRFYKLCKKWKKEIKKNPIAMKEQMYFVNSTVMNEALKKIATKLGIPDVSFEDAHAMYMTCAFETSFSKNYNSPWCSAFSVDTIKVLEYAEDLKYYWIDGYGHRLTYEQACPAIINMVNHFQSNEEYPKAVLYFTHSGTVLKLLAHLGLYKDDEDLRHDNFHQNSNRRWRVSKIDSFGSNIAAVLFKCGDTKKILFLHQERVVQLPGCGNTDLCDFQNFLNTFNDSINNCKFEEICEI